MANSRQQKLKETKLLLDEVLQEVTKSKTKFREFLQFQTRLYKHSFENALLIYGQNPNATACAELQDWNKISRRIKKGEKAMRVFTDDTQSNIKYLFDLENTYGKTFAYPTNTDIAKNHHDALLESFGVKPFSKDFNINFKWAIEEYVKEQANDYLLDFMYDNRRNPMEFDAFQKFKLTLTDAVCYSVCERFNIEKGIYADDKKSFKYFDTEHIDSKEMMFHLGVGTNEITKNAINHINKVIKQCISQENIIKEKYSMEKVVSLENVRIERAASNYEYERSNKGNDNSTKNGDVSGNGRGSNGIREDGSTTTDNSRIVWEKISKIHEGELQKSSEFSNQRGQMDGHLRTSEHGSKRDEGEPTKPIRTEESTSETRLHQDLPVGRGQEDLGRGNSSERSDLQEKIANLPFKVGDSISYFGDNYKVEKINIEKEQVVLYDPSHALRSTSNLEYFSKNFRLLGEHENPFKAYDEHIENQIEKELVKGPLNTQGSFLYEKRESIGEEQKAIKQSPKILTSFIVDDGTLKPNIYEEITDDDREEFHNQQQNFQKERREKLKELHDKEKALEENLEKNQHIEKIDGIDFVFTDLNVKPVPKISPEPIFFPDYKDIERSINFDDYKDGDIIGYNGEGVKYQVGKMENINYTTQTTFIAPNGEILGTENIPEYIYKQIQDYRNGINNKVKQEGESWTQQPVSQERNSGMSTENAIKLQEKATEKALNFTISSQNDIGILVGKGKYKENITAIKLVQQLELENRIATPIEQQILAKYSGFGSIPQAFDQNNLSWQNEYNELKSLLSSKEYRNALESTLNAHYTSTEVIDAMYKGLEQLGFQGGNVLEPSMGVGNFFGMFPNDLKEKSRLYGVELDETTGKLAKQLYPQANVQITGFESAKLQDNFFDVAVGNVPFGNYKVGDVKFDKYNMLIHDYFFAKTLDKVKPEGIIAFITSKGTMDKENNSVRKYLAERAEFLGAIRLPNTAFKESAGTDVTSDIIFLKKRDRMIDATNENWVYTSFANDKLNEHVEIDKIPLNQYFIDNPHMMLGNMELSSGRFGMETTLVPFSPEENSLSFSQQLKNAIVYLPKNIMQEQDINFLDDLEKPQNNTILADPNIKNFCFAVIEGEIYQREDSVMTKINFPKTTTDRVKSLIELRELTRNQLDIQFAGCSDDELLDGQKKLNDTYDQFIKKYGAINSKYNHRIFGDDADYPLLSSIEEVGDDETITKAAIFDKRTVTPFKKIESVETSIEALAVCLNEKGYVDIGFMSSLSSKTNEKTIEELQGLIFKNPFHDSFDKEFNLYTNWETADEYLSGEVVEKLKIAKDMAIDNPIYRQNITSLETVQPTPLTATEIGVKIGTSWIDEQYYRQFILETLKPSYHEQANVKVQLSKLTGTWSVEKPSSKNRAIESIERFGTKRMNAYELMENLLNQKNPKIYDRIPSLTADGNPSEKRVLNREQTIAIKDKADLLRNEFSNWIFKDPVRREHLVKVYNEKFNSTRQRQYDGSHLTFEGMSPAIKLKKHQLDGIARILYGGNSLLAHVVGAGKTYTMAAVAMEQKRLGLARKPCIVVPNHLVNQWANEFKRLYPNANILAATKKDFEKDKRQRFCGRIATGEWDCVIVGHSSFEKIPISNERLLKRLERDIEQAMSSLEELRASKDNKLTVKEMASTLKKLEKEQNTIINSPKDNLVTFEQLGIDALMVDEAHMFKNKFMFTKMTNVAGLSRTGAAKSTDMDLKCSYINELNQAPRNVTFATGTPISNSMTEMYTMQTYLQREKLEKLGLQFFDNWAANFGEVVSSLELAPSGQTFRVKERFAKFINLPELMNLYRQVADIQTADMLNLNVPTIKGGKPTIISVDASPEQKAFVDYLVDMCDKISRGEIDPKDYNMLCVTSDGRLCALDMRCLNQYAEDFADSKVNACVDQVFTIYKENNEKKLTQMIFSDVSTPNTENKENKFSVYKDIKDKLIEKGVKPEEIKFIHDAKTDEAKEEIFRKMRSGEIRVLIGSTAKMGAGTNCQTKLVALHHLDCPWRPSDLEQRNGRIVRQGNENPEVQILQYVTKGTFDAYLWQIVENKQRFISQVMSGQNPTRTSEDVDETVLNFAEVKAIATGNPLIKKKMELEMELSTLSVLEKQYLSSKYSLEDKVLKTYPTQIVNLSTKIEDIKKDIDLRGKNIDDEPFKMKLGKNDYEERAKAGELILRAINSNKYVGKEIGNYKGFAIIPQEKKLYSDTQTLVLKGNMTHIVEVSGSDTGTITRIENQVKNLEKTLIELELKLSDTHSLKQSATEELKKPFEHTQAKISVMEQLTIVNSELDIGKENISDTLIQDETGEKVENINVPQTGNVIKAKIKQAVEQEYEEEFEEDYEDEYEM